MLDGTGENKNNTKTKKDFLKVCVNFETLYEIFKKENPQHVKASKGSMQSKSEPHNSNNSSFQNLAIHFFFHN